MLFMDPPLHTAMRKLVNRAFTPRRIAALEDAHPRARAPATSTRTSAPAASTTSRDFSAPCCR